MSGRRALARLACSLAVLAGGSEAGELQDDLAARRARVLQRLGPETLLVLQSAPLRVYSRDVDYEYRQDSNLHYLTGIDQPETALVLMPGNAVRKEVLFIQPRDPVQEHREGRRLSVPEATARSGIAHVHLSSELEPFLESMLNRRPYGVPRSTHTADFDAFFKAMAEGRARLAVVMDMGSQLSGPLPDALHLANRVRERFPWVQVVNATDVLRDLRQVKTPYEQALLRRAVQVAAEAHRAAMKAARPGILESEVEGVLERAWQARGARGWSYPPIVASGPNATILHYSASSRRMEGGDLLLVDAAAHYEYVTGDITRTYPVSGKFTPAQRDIYSLVLAAQEAGMAAARAGVRTRDVHQATVEVVKKGLLELGLVTDTRGDQYRTWYTHGSVHWIGMDVHDVGDYERPLEPGMAFVIEPGIYVRESALDALPRTPENEAFIAKVRPAVSRYKDIGVRIEDSFLLTAAGLENLSASVPRTVAEVEAFLSAPR